MDKQMPASIIGRNLALGSPAWGWRGAAERELIVVRIKVAGILPVLEEPGEFQFPPFSQVALALCV